MQWSKYKNVYNNITQRTVYESSKSSQCNKNYRIENLVTLVVQHPGYKVTIRQISDVLGK